jgi:hypothetical protein
MPHGDVEKMYISLQAFAWHILTRDECERRNGLGFGDDGVGCEQVRTHVERQTREGRMTSKSA